MVAQYRPFQERFFGGDIYKLGERLCGSVFIAICDPALVERVARRHPDRDDPAIHVSVDG